MSQLSLFGSLFDTPPAEKKPEENQPAPKKEDRPTENLKDTVAPAPPPAIFQDPPVEDNTRDEAGRIDSMGENGILPGSSDYPSIFDEAIFEGKEETGLPEMFVDEDRPDEDPFPNRESGNKTIFAEEFVTVTTEHQEEVEETLLTPSTTMTDSRIISEKIQVPQPTVQQSARNGSVIFDDGKITVKIKNRPSIAPVITKAKREKIKKIPQKRGRKSFKEIDAEVDLIEVPDDEVLFQKQYYAISVVAKWFRVNTSLLRFWENEFDVLKPRKNRKGDRLFRPEDVKNLQLIYQLLRQKKYTVEGAKEYLKTNKKKADIQIQLTNTLQKMRSFLLDLKANLE